MALVMQWREGPLSPRGGPVQEQCLPPYRGYAGGPRDGGDFFLFIAFGLNTNCTPIEVVILKFNEIRDRTERMCLRACLRTRRTLEPSARHWSHWPGRLVNREGGVSSEPQSERIP